MPGLLRGIARTAVVAGTATAVSGRVRRRQGRRWGGQQEEEPQQSNEQQPPPPPAPAPAAPPVDPLAQLKELAELKSQGILTDQEFADQKARILAA